MSIRILIAACMSLAVTACAHTPSTTEVAAKPKALTRADCLTTGSRIPLKEGECVIQAGRVYSKEDLERSGAGTAAEALRRLDPAIAR
jgi:hypothetical protein